MQTTKPAKRLILGSSSGSRLRAMRMAELDPEVIAPNIDERQTRALQPEPLVLQLSVAKAQAVRVKITDDRPALIVTGDQVAVFDGQIREKPLSGRQFINWFADYANGVVELIGALSVTSVNTDDDHTLTKLFRVGIRYRPVPEKVLDEALRIGEVMRCCGGVLVEEPPLDSYVCSIFGTPSSDLYTAAMGVPRGMVHQMIARIESNVL